MIDVVYTSKLRGSSISSNRSDVPASQEENQKLKDNSTGYRTKGTTLSD